MTNNKLPSNSYKRDLQKSAIKKRKSASTKKGFLITTGIVSTVAAVGLAVPVALEMSTNYFSSIDSNNNNNQGAQGQGGQNDDSNVDSNNNQSKPITPIISKSSFKEVGLFDLLVKKGTSDVQLDQYWQNYFSSNVNKQKLISNFSEFSSESQKSIKVNVSQVEKFNDWTGTVSYNSWKSKVNSTIVYNSPKSTPMVVKDLKQLQTTLNNDAKLEELLKSSGFNVNTANTYKLVENSDIGFDSTYNYANINVLEDKTGNETDTNINLKLPLSEINFKSSFNVSIDNSNNSLVNKPANSSKLDFEYQVGITGKFEMPDNFSTHITLLPTTGDMYSLENVLKSMNFLNQEQTRNNSLDAKLNQSAISNTTNVFNVTWSNAQLIKKNNKVTGVSFSASPKQGQIWADTKDSKPKTISLDNLDFIDVVRDASLTNLITYSSHPVIKVNGTYQHNDADAAKWWTANESKYINRYLGWAPKFSSHVDWNSRKLVAVNATTSGNQKGITVTFSFTPEAGHGWIDRTEGPKNSKFTIVGFDW